MMGDVHGGQAHRRSGTAKSGVPPAGRFLSLQTRITLSVAVATTVMLVAFGYVATWAIEESTNMVFRDREQVARIVAARIAESLSGYRRELDDLAWELSRTAIPQPADTHGQAGRARHFSGLAVITREGSVAWSQPESLAQDLPALSSTLLAASPNGAIALPPVAGLPGAHLVAFVAPVPGSDRHLVGAVDLAHAGVIDTLHHLDTLHNKEEAPLDFELIDDRGIVLTSSDSSEVGRPSEHMPVIAALAGQERTGIVFHNVVSHPHYVAHTPLPGYPGWGVNIEQPRDVVLSLPHRLQRRMMLYGLVIVAGMSLLAFLDVRGVIRPLSRLRDAAEKIAGGNLDHPVQVDRRDEVGALAQTFETMRTTLKTSREEIATWNRELEDRVAERTRELTAMASENARLFALARREERNLASTVDLLSDGLLTVDLNRRILSLNPAAERLLGWASEEARGLMCTEFFECPGCPAGHQDAACPISAALEAGGTARGVRVLARRRGGEAFPALVTTGLGRDEAERPTHFIVTLKDMTTEEAYERQLQGRIRQLTTLNEIAQALSLLPLRTVEETAREVVQRVAAVTGSGCRLDLDAYGLGPLQAPAPPVPGGGSPEEHGSRPAGGPGRESVAEPVVLKGRRIGTLWLDPGPTELPGEDPTPRIIASQVAVAVENAGLYEDVRDRDALRRQLLDRIVVAQEEERRRMARELHDEIGQALTALVMQLGTAEMTLPPGASPLREQLAGIRSLTSQTVGEVRRLMLDLRPAVLDDLGLIPAIRWYVESHIPPAGIEATVSARGVDERQRLPRRVELVAFRLTQEALTNVLRHAKATSVTVAIERHGGGLEVSIADDGCGFDADAQRRRGLRGGWGLVGMEERVSLLGGRLTVTSAAGRGTRVTATIPTGVNGDGDQSPDRG